ncbi:DUF4350 domain-containing protein [Actinomyces faecalis]|uniref:DUF4350 domain-containing protein n=1 Tax=Actinomyces faecalis TaxID=2722820 RepID=UPI0015576898|nr:DUF4350 domain-containing protein [Actinomyces faecalis]
MSTTTPPAPAGTPTTAAPSSDQVAGERMGARLRRWRPLLMTLAVFLGVTLATALLRPPVSSTPLAVDNPRGTGAQALAALLRDQGVDVRKASSVHEAVSLVTDRGSAQGPQVTVALIHPGSLTEAERSALAASGADVTVIGSTYEDLTGLTDLVPSGASAGPDRLLTPQCADPDAQAARTLQGSKGSVGVSSSAPGAASGEVVTCFPVEDTGGYSYVVAPLSGGGTLRVIADASVATNNQLTTAGNAALSVRALGHHETLLWLDGSQHVPTSVWNPRAVPAWFSVAGLQALIALGVLALVRGRRFGRLVAEDLPVLVRATETTRGRGRLYRQAKDRRRAARALRAGTARRLGHRLGVPASADAGALTQAVAAATGYPERAIAHLLYGPTPDSNRSLADLATHLDRIENEVSQR